MTRTSGLRASASLLLFVLPLAARAQTYPPVPPPPPNGIAADELYLNYYPRSHEAKTPTQADLVMHQGVAVTFVVKMLNLTPYRIELTDATKLRLGQHTGKDGGQFVFAPLGVPTVIPPGALDPAGLQGDPNAHPLNFVLGWQRWEGGRKTVLNWVVRDVRYPPCVDAKDPTTCTTNDVYLGLWMIDVEATDQLEAGNYAFVMSITEETLALLGVLLDPFNPVSWAAFGFTTYHMIEGGIEFAEGQKVPDEGAEVYVSSYTVPDWNRNCFILNNHETWLKTGHTGEPEPPLVYRSCTPSTSQTTSDDSDAYDAQWGPELAGGGPTALVVLTSGLRGRAAHPTDRGPNANDVVELGSLPAVSVVVMTSEQYDAAQASLIFKQNPPMVGARPGPVDLGKEKVVKEARKFRDRYGVQEARRALVRALLSLGPEQRQVVREAILTLLDRNPLAKPQEKSLLDLLQQAERLVKDWRQEG